MATEKKQAQATPLGRRKLPQQERSRNTVECILQATQELVQARGFAKVGTRLIAERAGVNVASLYQYFPTYESILLTWYEDVVTRIAQEMRKAMLSVTHENLDVSVPHTNELLLQAFEKNALVLIQMVEEVPEIQRATRSVSLEILVRGTMRMYFNQHHEFDSKDTERHIFFLETVLFGSLRRYLKEEGPRDMTRKAFLEELSRIMIVYLEGDMRPLPKP